LRRVLIVGAGIGGLALAQALDGDDVIVDVVERTAALTAAGVGIVLHPNGMRALGALGLSDAIARAGNVIRSLELRRGALALEIPLAEVWQGAEYPTIAILRTELQTILAAGAFGAKRTRTTLRLGIRLVNVDTTDDAVVASFSDGSARRYDLVVGADGVHSGVRRGLAGAPSAVPTGLVYRRFVAANAIDLAPDTWLTIEDADRSYGFIPVARERLHCFVQVRHADDTVADIADSGYLDSTIAAWDARLAATMAARCGPVVAGAAMMLPSVAWGRGRVALLGDAAHAVAPTLSEGASLAIEDAVILARTLRAHDDVLTALAAYRAARDEPVRWALRMSAAQVNAARRDRREIQADRAIAEAHLRRMYMPLLHSLEGGSVVHSSIA
jgi:2-polyprenyl-6-methoxyphenol hydroxylase-like FAD-dependent oxidoreductase